LHCNIVIQLRSAHAQWSSVKVQQHNKDFNRFNAVLFVFKIGLKHVFFKPSLKHVLNKKKLFKKTVCFVLNKKNNFFANPGISRDLLSQVKKKTGRQNYALTQWKMLYCIPVVDIITYYHVV
jgi:hypothetical protein